MPSDGDPLVVIGGGVPAWIVRSPGRSTMLTTGEGLVELDAGAPGSLTDLVADGSRVHWRHDGEPRSADLG